MTRPADILPLSLPPRGLSRVQAAVYVGTGTTKFDEMVKDGRMPAPKQVDGRNIWDRLGLDESFTTLPSDDVADDDANPWDGEDEGRIDLLLHEL